MRRRALSTLVGVTVRASYAVALVRLVGDALSDWLLDTLPRNVEEAVDYLGWLR